MKGDTMKAKRAKFAKVEFGELSRGDRFYMDDLRPHRSTDVYIKVEVYYGLHGLEGVPASQYGSLRDGVVWIMSPTDLVWVRVK